MGDWYSTAKARSFIGLGENNQRPTAQDLDKLQGKVVPSPKTEKCRRITFVNTPGARPEIWVLRHSQPAGDGDESLERRAVAERARPARGDEINIPEKGNNLRLPLATHGINYSGLKIPEAKGEHVEGTEKTAVRLEVSPAVSGMAFYNSDSSRSGKNKLFIGALKEKDGSC